MALQATHQFGDERAAHRRLRTRHVGDDQDQALRVILDDLNHCVGPARSQIAMASVAAYPGRDAAQVLDQGQAQHDRNRPQLAERERLDLLVGAHEAADGVLVDAAVAVRDRVQCDVVDARQSSRCATLQTWQFPAVAFGEMQARGADLVVNQVQVVEQPFARGCNPMPSLDRIREQRATVAQDTFVIRQASQQAVGTFAGRDCVFASNNPPVFFHLLRAEQLGAQRCIAVAAVVVDGQPTTGIGGPHSKRSAGRWHEDSRCGRVGMCRQLHRNEDWRCVIQRCSKTACMQRSR